MAAPQGLIRHRDAASELVLDSTLAPILVATFFGEITVPLVHAFNAWMDQHVDDARARGGRLALVADAIDSERPGTQARQAFAEHPHDNTILVSSPCVIVSPLVRGALTAIGWVMGEKMGNVTSWPTLEAASTEAVRALKGLGVSVPEALVVSYRRPIRSGDSGWVAEGQRRER